MQTNNMISLMIHRNVMLLLMWVMLFVSGFNAVRGQIFVKPLKIPLQIWNGLGPGVELLVHCKSGDDDVGAHLIHFNQSFSFVVVPSFLENTLYFCAFRFNNEVHWFDIYRYWRDFFHCDMVDCSWKIKPEGPCRLQNNQYPTI
jgi:hypothetical protein